MAPIGNAMRFIDYEETDARGDWQEVVRHEVFVAQSFWGNEQYVYSVLTQCVVDTRPVVQVRGIDGLAKTV